MRISTFRRAVVITAILAVAGLPSSAATAATAASVNGPYAVYGFGTAAAAGVPAPPYPQGRLVGIAANATGSGYWVAAVDGRVYAYGGAPDGGSAAFISAPIAGIAANPSGPGYWTVGSDGTVYALGGAPEGGSWRFISAPIVGIAANPTGPGYWILGVDGAVYPLGGAPTLGDARGGLGAFATAIVANPAGTGYWILGANGVTAARGAPDLGNAVGGRFYSGAAATQDGRGLWLLATTGGIATVGSAPDLGALPSPPFALGLALAAAPNGPGYWALHGPGAPTPAGADHGGRPPAGSGSGRRIVYANAAQRVWIMNEDDSVYSTYRVSGKRFVPNPGSYRIYTRTTGRAGDLRLEYFVGFAYGSGGGNIGFHRIPIRPDGSQIEADSQLGTPLSHGCVRESLADAQRLFNWSRIGDLVVVLP